MPAFTMESKYLSDAEMRKVYETEAKAKKEGIIPGTAGRLQKVSSMQ